MEMITEIKVKLQHCPVHGALQCQTWPQGPDTGVGLLARADFVWVSRIQIQIASPERSEHTRTETALRQT